MKRNRTRKDPYTEHYVRHYGQLVGGIIQSVHRDSTPDPLKALYALKIKVNGRILYAWILGDAEGNGPGFLEFQKATP